MKLWQRTKTGKHMSYCVYIHQNKRNGKVYVGLTSRKPETRWNGGSGYISNKPFYNAIKKYGWNDGFSHQIVAENLTADEAEQLEKDLIKMYQSNNPAYGYNMTDGGFGYNGFTIGINPTYQKLPEYSHIKNDEIASCLFNRLLSIAYGGDKISEVTRIFEDDELIEKKTTTFTTEPNMLAIDTIIENYQNVPELHDYIERLKKVRETRLVTE